MNVILVIFFVFSPFGEECDYGHFLVFHLFNIFWGHNTIYLLFFDIMIFPVFVFCCLGMMIVPIFVLCYLRMMIVPIFRLMLSGYDDCSHFSSYVIWVW